MRSYNRNKKGVCAKKGESVPIVKRRKKRSERVYKGAAKKRIYSAIKITTNGTSIFYRKKEWKEEDGVRL